MDWLQKHDTATVRVYLRMKEEERALLQGRLERAIWDETTYREQWDDAADARWIVEAQQAQRTLRLQIQDLDERLPEIRAILAERETTA